jgi:hypothetical protein
MAQTLSQDSKAAKGYEGSFWDFSLYSKAMRSLYDTANNLTQKNLQTQSLISQYMSQQIADFVSQKMDKLKAILAQMQVIEDKGGKNMASELQEKQTEYNTEEAIFNTSIQAGQAQQENTNNRVSQMTSAVEEIVKQFGTLAGLAGFVASLLA